MYQETTQGCPCCRTPESLWYLFVPYRKCNQVTWFLQTHHYLQCFLLIPDDAVPFAVEQNHLPRPYASECAGMRVGVEGAAKSLHLPRLHALQVTPAGVSVEGDFVLAGKYTYDGVVIAFKRIQQSPGWHHRAVSSLLYSCKEQIESLNCSPKMR